MRATTTLSCVLLIAITLVCLSMPIEADQSDYCPFVEGKGQDRREPTRDTLKIAQWNVDWLFLKDKGGNANCPGTGCPWHDEGEARQHFDQVASEIIKLDADIINLVEVQDCSALRYLADQVSKQGDHTYRPFCLEGTGYLGQNVGLLTRIDPVEPLQRTVATASYPVEGTKCPALPVDYNGTTMSVSKHFFTRFHIQGEDILMVSVHLLAHPLDPIRCHQREAQATVLIGLIEQLLDSYDDISLIIIGDFNDYDADVKDAANSVPITRTLEMLKSEFGLTSVGEGFKPQSELYTSWWDKNKDKVDDAGEEHGAIDHILLGQELYDRVELVSYVHDFNQTNTFMSDHWPILIELEGYDYTRSSSDAPTPLCTSDSDSSKGSTTSPHRHTSTTDGSSDCYNTTLLVSLSVVIAVLVILVLVLFVLAVILAMRNRPSPDDFTEMSFDSQYN